MKRRISRGAVLAALVCAFAPRVHAADPQKLFEEANQLYQQSRYDEAIAAYRSLLTLAPRSAALHYNMGNAFFRFGQPGSLGLAIASYERAFALRPRDSDIRHNLDFTLRRAGESLVPAGVPSALFVLFHLLSSDELAALQWLGLWYCALIGSLYLLSQKRRPVLRPWLMPGLAIWALAAAWWGARAMTMVSAPGVILQPSAEVRSGPGENFPVSFKAPEGRLITILDQKDDWLEIGVLKEGLKGWLQANTIEKI